MEEWIGLRECAERCGRTHGALQKAITSGRIPESAVRRVDGRIEAVEYHAVRKAWLENTDPDQAARTAEPLTPSTASAAASSSTPPAPSDKRDEQPAAKTSDDHGYLEARAERERHQAKLSELELLEQLGQLVSVDEMKQVAARRYRAVRDKVLGVPDRVSAILAAEKDPARVHAALSAELKRVLHELSDDARAESARGFAERVAA